MDVKGKIVVVTGGSSGIGRAIVEGVDIIGSNIRKVIKRVHERNIHDSTIISELNVPEHALPTAVCL